jgi:hypothetical protein
MEDGELLSNELQYLPEDKHSKDLSGHNLDLDSLVRSANITKDLKVEKLSSIVSKVFKSFSRYTIVTH